MDWYSASDVLPDEVAEPEGGCAGVKSFGYVRNAPMSTFPADIVRLGSIWIRGEDERM